MTTGLETATRTSRQLYKVTLKSGCTQDTVDRYRKRRNLLNQLKRTTMKTYYATRCEEYKNNTKTLWQVINETISKCKHSGSVIPFITIDGIKTSDSKKIANKFGNFYASLGSSLAAGITPGPHNINKYLKNIPRRLNSMVLKHTTQREKEQVINELPNKSSCRHDKISNTLLKELKSSISYPLTVVFNQLILSGTFLDMMKIAGVILLYKGKE